ncbi:MAG: LPS export ABC transporter periplasmic protein LptC [Polaromonas sp.]|uniref:LPS export ABC transporter periplasmic protein LptC n=1 Tax=Polaromonas sp. TaxID=1869339 RepID=UPI00272F94E5|nr:LPS export ABC transporter periplasmic protein LptC [Polaromonas sp.]MDP1742237.1 LPS export ABC transporter periplasmic protein LptC [Polaromonas sp.]MDP1952968.1 LPS export ABC transporter periplasmic protein LptC [Polaromonas sp.]MDP3751813.1 LPS export ABC transporter periplasmic protein LptC [Polaromonas sp.]
MLMATAAYKGPSGSRVPGWRIWLDRLSLFWERTSIYIPVLLMGLLALGTYWLVRNTPASLPPDGQRVVGSEPDYYMRRFGIKTFDDVGQLKSDVSGAELRHYPDTDTLEIDKALIRSYSIKGRLTTSTGDRALTNGDGSEVQLIGNARVVREAGVDPDGQEVPRLEFQGEFLHVFVTDERVKSHLPVVITRGSDRFAGDTFAYDNLDRVADLHGRVKVLLVPRKAASAP